MYGALGHESYASHAMAGTGVLGLGALFLMGRHARKRLDPSHGRRNQK
jgi:hypothetical protein